MSKIIAVVNQKGGVGKTTTTLHLGVGLAASDKRVLLVDADPQASLTVALGYQTEHLNTTISSILQGVMQDDTTDTNAGVLHHCEGVDLIGADIGLASIELAMISAMAREFIMQQALAPLTGSYDYIIVDCPPTLSMLTINALTAAQSVIVPVTPQYLAAKGLELLLNTIFKVQRQLNNGITIDGILLTMVSSNTVNSKDIIALLDQTYAHHIKIYNARIPHTVRVPESSANGQTVYRADPKGKAAAAYRAFVEEVIGHD